MVEVTYKAEDFVPMEGHPDTYVSVVDNTIMVCRPGQTPEQLINEMKVEAKAEEALKANLTSEVTNGS